MLCKIGYENQATLIYYANFVFDNVKFLENTWYSDEMQIKHGWSFYINHAMIYLLVPQQQSCGLKSNTETTEKEKKLYLSFMLYGDEC